MILRRFIKHVTEQNWFAVGLDVCVVIVGIFLGMQVTEWNEERKRQAKLERYYGELIADLQLDIDDWNNAKSYLLQVRDHGMKAIAILELNTLPDKELVFHLFQATHINIPATYQDAFSEMNSLGIKAEIQDRRLKAALSHYYNNMDAVLSFDRLETDFRRNIRSYYLSSLRNILFSECGDIRNPDYGENLRYQLNSECDFQPDPELVKKQIELLGDYSGMSFDLRYHLSVIDSLLFDVNFVISTATELQLQLNNLSSGKAS